MASVSHRRRTYYRVVFWSSAVFAVWFGLFSGYGAITRWGLEAECSTLREQIKGEKTIADSLRMYARALLYDTLEIERIARERYGMIKSGEEVYIIRKQE